MRHPPSFVKPSKDASTLMYELFSVQSFPEAKAVLRRYENAAKITVFESLFSSGRDGAFSLKLRDTDEAILSIRRKALSALHPSMAKPQPIDEKERAETLDRGIYSLLEIGFYLKEVKEHNQELKSLREFSRLMAPDKAYSSLL